MPIPEFLRERTQAAVGSLNAHRILLYGAVSTIAVTAAIVNALRNYSNFYSVAIYLSKSSRSVLVSAHSIHPLVVILIHPGSGKFRPADSIVMWSLGAADLLRDTESPRSRGAGSFNTWHACF